MKGIITLIQIMELSRTSTSVKHVSGEYTPVPRKRLKAAEKLEFCTIKSKLKSVVKDEATRRAFGEYALLAHEALDRAFSFFRLYCLSLPDEDDLPELSDSTITVPQPGIHQEDRNSRMSPWKRRCGPSGLRSSARYIRTRST